jgi:hypothetical protein
MFNPPAVIFRDKRGRFVSAAKRYSPETIMVQRRVRGQYVTVIRGKGRITPFSLAQVLDRITYERLPPALVPVKEFRPRGIYKAWNAAGKIDKMRGLRGHLVKVTMTIADGKRRRQISFMHSMKKRARRNVSLWRHMNAAIGMQGFYFYNQVAGRILADRIGKRVDLVSVKVEKAI